MSSKDYENLNKDYLDNKSSEFNNHRNIKKIIGKFIIFFSLLGIIMYTWIDVHDRIYDWPFYRKLEIILEQFGYNVDLSILGGKKYYRKRKTVKETYAKNKIINNTEEKNNSSKINNSPEINNFKNDIESYSYDQVKSLIKQIYTSLENLEEDFNSNKKLNKNENISKREKLINYNQLLNIYTKEKAVLKEKLNILYKKRAELEGKIGNVRNIKNYYNMTEEQLSNEVNNIKKEYTYYYDLKLSSFDEARLKIISEAVNKKYLILLDEILTKWLVNGNFNTNNKKIEEEFYREVYSVAHSDVFFKDFRVFDIFIKHGINIKKVKDGWENNLLHLFASKGNITYAKKVLDSGLLINEKNFKNETPFYLAVKNNKFEMVKFLVEEGALDKETLRELNTFGNILYYPVINNNFEMLEYLVNKGISLKEDLKYLTNNRTILRFIISNGKTTGQKEISEEDKKWQDAYNYIIDGKINQLDYLEFKGIKLSKMYYDGEPGICIAAKNVKLSVVRYFLKTFDCKNLVDSINGRNVMHYAAMNSDSSILNSLIKNGFDVNVLDKDKNTPLNLALLTQNVHNAKQLFENGANPNILNAQNQNALFFAKYSPSYHMYFSFSKKKANYFQKDIYGNNLIHDYLINSIDQRPYISNLISIFDINEVNLKKQTALHLAILTENVKAAEDLLKNGADTNIQDIDGNTPLHYVAKYYNKNINFKEIKEYFNKSKCKLDFTIKNNEGKTPLDIVETSCWADYK